MCKVCETRCDCSNQEQKPALDIHRRKVAATRSDAFSEHTARRYKAKKVIDRLLHGQTVALCGKFAINSPNVPGIRVFSDGEVASISGVQRCGSADCPLCGAVRANRNRENIQSVCAGMIKAGQSAVMVTFTFQHERYENLNDLIQFRSKALKRMRSDRSFRELMKSYGHDGDIRVDEETHGSNGWHPHIHMLFFFKDLEPHNVKFFEASLFRIWQRIVDTTLDGRIAKRGGFSVEWVTSERVGEYLSKWDITYEMTYGHMKDKGAGRSYFQILLDLADGDANCGDEALVREHYFATKGKRRIGFSRGLKTRFSVVELTDDQVAEDFQNEEAEPVSEGDKPMKPVLSLNEKIYRALVRSDAMSEFLVAVASGGFSGGLDVFNRLKIPWQRHEGLFDGLTHLTLVE